MLEQELTLTTPAGARVDAARRRASRRRGRCATGSPGRGRGADVVAALRVEVGSGEMTAEEAAAFRPRLRALWDALSEGVVYRTS